MHKTKIKIKIVYNIWNVLYTINLNTSLVSSMLKLDLSWLSMNRMTHDRCVVRGKEIYLEEI